MFNCIGKKNIIGIFDLDTSTVSAVTRNFLREKEKRGRISGIDKTNERGSVTGLPKSFVLMGKEDKIYFSPKTVKSLVKEKRLPSAITTRAPYNALFSKEGGNTKC